MISRKRFFLASASKLIRERDLTEIAIHRKNSSIIDRNMFFEVVRWEELLQTTEPGGVQKRFSAWVGDCDVMIALFYDTVGPFTKEEIDIAFRNFNSGRNPRHILMYFKNSLKRFDKFDIEGAKRIRDLKKKIRAMGQMYHDYPNLAELELHLIQQLDKLSNVFEKDIGLLMPSESHIMDEAAKISTDPSIVKHIPNEKEVRELARSIGLFDTRRINPHLVFEEGDIKYFWERRRPRPSLEIQLRARCLVLQRADELGLVISEPGDLSEKAKPVEVRLLAFWQARMAKLNETS